MNRKKKRKGHPISLELKIKLSRERKGVKTGIVPKSAFKKADIRLLGENNSSWKGEKVGKKALHDWVKRWFGFPNKCENCGFESDSHLRIQWANKSGKYMRNREDWLRLCVPCHHKKDRIHEKIWENRRKKISPDDPN